MGIRVNISPFKPKVTVLPTKQAAAEFTKARIDPIKEEPEVSIKGFRAGQVLEIPQGKILEVSRFGIHWKLIEGDKIEIVDFQGTMIFVILKPGTKVWVERHILADFFS